MCSSLSTAFLGGTPSNPTHSTEAKHSNDYHRHLHGAKSSCLALEKKKKFEMEFCTAIPWSLVPGLSTSGSFSRTNSIQIVPGHTMTFLLD